MVPLPRSASAVRTTTALVLVALVALAAGCRGQDEYCGRARSAFDEIESLRGDPQARTDPTEALARLKRAFGGLRDGAPDDVQGDVDTLLRHVDSLRTPEDVARQEPADVRAAGDHLADWLGRNCDA